MGVVISLAAVPDQQHEWGEVVVKPHGVQHARGKRHLGISIQPHQLRAAHRAIAGGQPGLIVVNTRSL